METKKTRTDTMTVMKDISNDSTENKVKDNVNRNSKTYGKYTGRKYRKSDTKSYRKTTGKTTKSGRFRLLKDLYGIHSSSGKEGRISRFICGWIRTNVPGARTDWDRNTGNIYITKGSSDTYPCMVAHLDQVQDYHPSDFRAVETDEIIFGYSAKDRKYCGLGADDKNGIWLCIQGLLVTDVLKVAFFVEEETGCAGSGRARMEFFDDCRFVIEPDRKGSSDLITRIGFTDICSDSFIQATEYSRYGYRETDGMMTDVAELKGQGLGISCVNVSCGYYEPHTDREYTVKKDLLKSWRFIRHILTDCREVYRHEAVFERAGDSRTVWWDEYEDAYSTVRDAMTEDPTLTPSDIHSFYGEEYPMLCFDDFAMICDDVQTELQYEENEDMLL